MSMLLAEQINVSNIEIVQCLCKYMKILHIACNSYICYIFDYYCRFVLFEP